MGYSEVAISFGVPLVSDIGGSCVSFVIVGLELVLTSVARAYIPLIHPCFASLSMMVTSKRLPNLNLSQDPRRWGKMLGL